MNHGTVLRGVLLLQSGLSAFIQNCVDLNLKCPIGKNIT